MGTDEGTATSGIDPMGDAYAMGRSEAETERLIRQSGLYAPFTRRLFEQAGLRPGMRVLVVARARATWHSSPPRWSVPRSPMWGSTTTPRC